MVITFANDTKLGRGRGTFASTFEGMLYIQIDLSKLKLRSEANPGKP